MRFSFSAAGILKNLPPTAHPIPIKKYHAESHTPLKHALQTCLAARELALNNTQ